MMDRRPIKPNDNLTKNMTITALLTALGILIPLIMPFKIVIGPASYTLGSHIPVNMAMLRSPFTTMIVAVGTTLGFLISGVPIVIVFRALSHVIYAGIGAVYLQNHASVLTSTAQRTFFNLIINIIHGLAEVVVVYILTALGAAQLSGNYWYVLLVLVGLGTVIHGMIDFELSYQFVRTLDRRTHFNFTTLEI